MPGGHDEAAGDSVKPISPKDVAGQIPDAVLSVFNTLITQNFRSGSACVLQDNVVAELVKRGLNRDEIFNRGWLDVEALYRGAGWTVEYNKPAYNDEPYPATFTFRPARKKA